MDDLLTLSASRMTSLLASGGLSSVDLTDAVIRRIEAVNPTLNAVITLDAERALEAARACDAARSKGEGQGPLQGLPMTVKDSFETAGLRSTAGTPGRQDFIPVQDATAVARLRAAGAIVVGKSSTPELTLRFETRNRLIGRTANPHDPQRTPGGSSGGAAALVAAGASPAEIGSDTGGSIRLPAHFCGIAGLKPTAGRVSRAGHVPHLEFPLVEGFTQIGPLARRVEDLALLYPVLAGADPRDPFTLPMPVTASEAAIADLRVAVYTDNDRTPVCADTLDTVTRVASLLAEANATVTQTRPPGVGRSPDLWHRLFLADGGAGVRAALATYGTQSPDPLLDWTEGQEALSARELTQSLEDWAVLRRDSLMFMTSLDCLICPVNAQPAPVAGDAGPVDYTQHYNLLGWPVAVVRCGTSALGLPIGVQIVAPPWREDICLSVAAFLEQEMQGWHMPTPPAPREG